MIMNCCVKGIDKGDNWTPEGAHTGIVCIISNLPIVKPVSESQAYNPYVPSIIRNFIIPLYPRLQNFPTNYFNAKG